MKTVVSDSERENCLRWSSVNFFFATLAGGGGGEGEVWYSSCILPLLTFLLADVGQ